MCATATAAPAATTTTARACFVLAQILGDVKCGRMLLDDGTCRGTLKLRNARTRGSELEPEVRVALQQHAEILGLSNMHCQQETIERARLKVSLIASMVSTISLGRRGLGLRPYRVLP